MEDLLIHLNLNETNNRTLFQLEAYKKYIQSFLFVLNYCLIPLIICLGLLLTFVSINVFLHSRVKSIIYKYLLFNSIFDMITLCIAFINVFTSLFNSKKFLKYGDYFEIYFFLYVSSVTLTCSNLTKIALAFERILKLKQKCKCLTDKRSLKLTISSILLFSMLANFPILIAHNFFSKENYIITPSLVFMRLKKHNDTRINSYGSFFVVNSIVLDVITFIGVVLVDVLLIIVIKKSLNKISRFQRNNRQNIEFEIVNDNQDQYDQSNNLPNLRVSADLLNETVIFENTNNILPINESIASGQTPEIRNAQSEKSKNIELAFKCTLSKMIQLYCLVFIFGHVFYSTTSLLIQTQYLSTNDTFSINKNKLELFISISLLLLYASYCGNFFVYYMYNSLFRSILNGENVNTDENPISAYQNSHVNNGESVANRLNIPTRINS